MGGEADPQRTPRPVPGRDLALWIGDTDAVLDGVEAFVTGVRAAAVADRMLSTVLFTDIVGSMEKAVELGDAAWKELLDRHYEVIQGSSRGSAPRGGHGWGRCDGDLRRAGARGFMRGSHREICSQPCIEPRAGVDTGEVELAGTDIRGIAVHMERGLPHWRARPRSSCHYREGPRRRPALAFEDAGLHELKGVPGTWRIFRVAG